MQRAKTTILVVTRERFSSFSSSLQSLFSTVSPEVPVIVVDCGAPASICIELAQLQSSRSFEWIHTEYFLTPHEARNRALPLVKTGFVVFADNDLHYESGWLEALEANAAQYHADVVAPLICIGPPVAQKIHHAGGEFVWHQKNGRDYIDEKHRLSGVTLTEAVDFESTAPLANHGIEFHCALLRMSALEQLGPFDDRMIHSEHLDFALRCLMHNLKITFEKNSVVTYMAANRFTLAELDYFFFRWDVNVVQQSIRIIEDLWELGIKDVDDPRRWVKHHQQRVVASVFLPSVARRVKHELLLGLVSPLRYLYQIRAVCGRKRHAAEPIQAVRPDSQGITRVKQLLGISVIPV